MPIERLAIRYVPLSKCVKWDRNAKKHDIGGIMQAIERYGFRDPPTFDAKLKALATGNGTLEAVEGLHGQDAKKVPRGIALHKGTGEWLVPLVFGCDAASRAEAEAFAVDHNNLTVMGGDLGLDAILGLWEEDGLKEVLQSLGEAEALPVTLDGDDLDAMLMPPPEPEKKNTKTVVAVACCPNCGTQFETKNGKIRMTMPDAPAQEKLPEQ